MQVISGLALTADLKSVVASFRMTQPSRAGREDLTTAAEVYAHSRAIGYVRPTTPPTARYREGIRTVMTTLGLSR